METRVVFGVKYETQKIVVVETGFWLWKKRKPHTVDNISIITYQKPQPVEIDVTHVTIPIFGLVKIKERVIRHDHLEIWLGYHGFAGSEDHFINEESYHNYEHDILLDGFQKIARC